MTLYSDSRYVVDGMAKGWAEKWRKNGWRRNKKEMAINPDMWGRLLDLCEKHEVEFRWVRGHAGIPENERCDRLAVAASQQKNLPTDPGVSGGAADHSFGLSDGSRLRGNDGGGAGRTVRGRLLSSPLPEGEGTRGMDSGFRRNEGGQCAGMTVRETPSL